MTAAPLIKHLHLASRDHEATGGSTRPTSTSASTSFGFLMPSDSAARELLARMQRDGVTIVIPARDTDPFFSFFCADPDGHHVQIYFDPAAV